VTRLRSGMTLVELLVAAAMLGILLAALAGMFVSTHRAYRVTETVTERQQAVEALKHALIYDIGRAGYRGTSGTCGAGGCFDSNTFSASTLSITKAASDTVVVRYYEDPGRLFDGGTAYVLQTVTFTVSDGNLVRNGNTLVFDVTRLEVTEFVLRSGDSVAVTAGMSIPDDLAGLTINVTMLDGTVHEVLVGLDNLQQAASVGG
jgi:prepilin-type N-terminal cleavage/methylation domain-containing protein